MDVLSMTNRELALKYEHLVVLANAALPDTQSENLVARYLSDIKPAIRARQKRMRELEEARQRYVSLDEDTRKERIADWITIQRDIEAVWEEVVEVPVPRRKLTDANFPRPLKRAAGHAQDAAGNSVVLDGASNSRGNAAVKNALAPEYYEHVGDTPAAEPEE